MWTWINCYLSGRHDYGMWCEPGAIFLRCIHCGKRSSGWALDPSTHPRPRPLTDARTHAPAPAPAPKTTPATRPSAARTSRVLPFDRIAARVGGAAAQSRR
jgi:hypothetical protein